jgi:hypothetical protein
LTSSTATLLASASQGVPLLLQLLLSSLPALLLLLLLLPSQLLQLQPSQLLLSAPELHMVTCVWQSPLVLL